MLIRMESGFPLIVLGFAGFSWKTGYPSIFIGFNYSKFTGIAFVKFHGRYSQIGFFLQMLTDQFSVIHFVYMIAGKDKDQVGFFLLDGIKVLIDSICRSFIPVLIDPLLRMDKINIFSDAAIKEAPGSLDMSVERKGFILC